MHSQAADWLESLSKRTGALGHVLEIGSANYNGTARTYFQKQAVSWTGIDIVAGPDVDVVVDITDDEAREDFVDESMNRNHDFFNTVVCTEVLEHIDPKSILDAALMCLEPDFGGRLIITCAGEHRLPHGADGGPLKPNEYYKNVLPHELVATMYQLLSDELVPRSATIEVEWNNKSHDVYMYVIIHANIFY
jgi:hypothetical protein